MKQEQRRVRIAVPSHVRADLFPILLAWSGERYFLKGLDVLKKHRELSSDFSMKMNFNNMCIKLLSIRKPKFSAFSGSNRKRAGIDANSTLMDDASHAFRT